MWICWASMALAVLSKGLVGIILPGAVLVLYTVIARDWALWKRLHLIGGLIVFFAIVTPWFVLVQQRNPEFLNFFFIVQQFKRYLTPEQNRPGAIYYFVPVLLVGFLPWLSVTAQSVRHAWRQPRQPNGFAPVTLMMTWIVFIFLFFSASHSKLLSYTLPIAPPIAMLIGMYLPLVTRDQLRRHLAGYALFFVVAAFAALFLGRLGSGRNPAELYLEYRSWVLAALGVAFVLTLAALWLNRRSKAGILGAVASFGAAWLLLGTIAGTGHDVFGRQSSGALLAPAIKAQLAKLPADTPFYSVGVLDHTLPFYVDHTTIMVEHADELTFGVSVEPHKWVPSIDQWIERWKADRYALALIPPSTYDRLLTQGLPMQVVARDSRRVVVMKPLEPQPAAAAPSPVEKTQP
jgi:4-amino-4-deoxy-L-arabinose transferase-like glycosyltransferase